MSPSPSPSTPTALDALRRSGILIASDTAEYTRTSFLSRLQTPIEQRRARAAEICSFSPEDATTNPSLVYAAITQPAYAHLASDAAQYAFSLPDPSLSLSARAESACDYLLVSLGLEILHLIRGRVSISIDPRIAHNTPHLISKSRALIALFEARGLTHARERVLVKIPGTYAGILACRALEADTDTAIHTNATLIFGLVQAQACAQARVAVISPFVGRVKDWWDARGDVGAPCPSPCTSPCPKTHQGLALLHTIRTAFDAHGHTSRTAIMAAGFRAASEVVCAAAARPDVVTLQVALLRELSALSAQRGAGVLSTPACAGACHGDSASDDAAPAHLGVVPVPEPRYVVCGDGEGGMGSEAEEAEAEALFVRDLEAERIALDKVPEGLARFAVDAKRLEDLLREMIRVRMEGGVAGR